MGRLRTVLVAPAIVAMAAQAPRAQDSEFWSFLEDGQILRRCAPLTVAHSAATANLQRLEDQVNRLKEIESHRSVLEELHALLKSECFLQASETGRVPHPDSSLSLKTWWNDGGQAWLHSYLELPRQGDITRLEPHIIVPPDPRPTLHLDTNRNHRLGDLLCLAADSTCASDTRGWMQRADQQFEAHRALNRRDTLIADPAQMSAGPLDCRAQSANVGPDRRYEMWLACVELNRPRRSALPLGAFKSPSTGWLVVAGRRGHYDFCDTTRAYDLETGTAFISDSCSGLALLRDGSVNVERTNERRRERTETGTVSVDNLREALWMMVLREETVEIQLYAEYLPLPSQVSPDVTVHGDNGPTVMYGGSWNTGQTVLVWRWIRPGQPSIDGDLRWPDSDKGAEDHAASLLDIAEQSLITGCPRRRVPASLSIQRRQPVNRLDAPGASVDTALAAALPKWKAIPACR